MVNRKKQINNRKSFNMVPAQDLEDESALASSYQPIDFSKIRVGLKTLDDAVIDFGDFKKLNPRLGDKKEVLRAIDSNDWDTMRDISLFFFRTSGIYSRLCRYMAYLYRYDWIVTPYINKGSKINKETLEKDFYNVLNYLDNFEAKQFFGEVALKVIKVGCYYGYIVPYPTQNKVTIQELPAHYCRSRFSVGGRPAVEFNMKFFDEFFRDRDQRNRVLNLFPPEFKKGYNLYKQGRLLGDFIGDTAGWYLLEVGSAIKFNLNDGDTPPFMSVIPAIIDLNNAQALDRKKMEQQLLKIIIQKMPINKDGDLVFDPDEAQELHNNSVRMLKKAIGIDVLTTYADVDVADMSDSTQATAATDNLERVERTVYNEAGVSQMQFNTDGNIALEKSILNDEASMYYLVSQFEGFLNDLLQPFNNKKVRYKVQILSTTIYNYKDMAKAYKEQTQLGYSKMLPQIALGQSQSSVLANAYFENEILDLVNTFIPPMSSNTMNSEVLLNKDKNSEGNGEVGRNEKPDDEKAEKTIQNKESMN